MKNRSLISKLHRPILVLSIGCFIGFAGLSFFFVEDLVKDSVDEQADAIISVLKDAVRDDVLNGFDNEVYRKCTAGLKNGLVEGVRIIGLSGTMICDQGIRSGPHSFTLEKKIYFGPDQEVEAGAVKVWFNGSIVYAILKRILLGLTVFVLILAFSYFLLSRRLVESETKNFTKLAKLLSESDMKALLSCSSHFDQNSSLEMVILCKGVENLSQNWLAFQDEALRSERLMAINESSRVLAHDIKSPLGALKTASQMMMEKPEPSKKLLDRGILKIEEMVFDLINTDAGDIVSLQDIEVVAFISEIMASLAKDFQRQSHIQLVFESSIKSKTLAIDPSLIERAIENLVKNSIEAIGKDQGQVSVTISENSTGRLTLSVEDSGPGIPQDILSHYGEGQVDSTKINGSGLGGLQVAKTMKLHKGFMKVSSRSKGTKIDLIF